jgi:hypothetical protein
MLKLMFFSKNTWKCILLSIYEQKKVFSAIYKPKSEGNCLFFHRFCIFWAAWGRIRLSPLTAFTTTSGPGTPPAKSGAPSSF